MNFKDDETNIVNIIQAILPTICLVNFLLLFSNSSIAFSSPRVIEKLGYSSILSTRLSINFSILNPENNPVIKIAARNYEKVF
ncbi:hypothetical protein [Nostoc sp. MG11]|uniref:hypothetical protein n=1 Tax=Nostoc sp. MG11 TaxID=2721166 RepID=UPI0018685F6D|nr:hypothetical protein [Nostoc sp. MG11]